MVQCNLTGTIPSTLGQLKELTELFLYENNLAGDLPGSLCSLTNMTSLDLSFNKLTGKIPGTFFQLKKLELLNLMHNRMSGSIPPFIGELPELRVLQLWDNKFHSQLPQNLGQNGNLQILDASGNKISGPIPRQLCKGGKLMWLFLMNNAFTGPIPHDLGACKSITKLNLGRNRLNGTIPPELLSLPLAEIIQLRNNNLSGQIPSLISGNALQTLDLSHNSITGRIPQEIQNLVRLQKLFLGMNKLSGNIPGELFHLKNLTMIYASGNNISGEIPRSVGSCSSLIFMDFSRNNLDGQIPPEISELKILAALNLSRNHLTGNIPAEMKSMTGLVTLDLSFNNLSGRIPSGGQFALFRNEAFAGNPNLCFSSQPACRSSLESSSIQASQQGSSYGPEKMASIQYDHVQEGKNKKKACVVGGTGFVASLLVKLLLQKGYAVNTTVRDPDNLKKVSHLLELQDLGELKLFRANLTDEGSFDAAIEGCEIVFLIATPVNFASQDPENDMIKPAVQGVTNVLRACTKAKSVKRVVMTSSAAAVSINKLSGTGLVMTENDWTDVDLLYSEKPPTWGYPVSKTLAEREAWKFAQENNLNLITVIPTLMTGVSLTPDVPSSVGLATCLLTGNEFLINGMKGMQMLSGSISITHVEDVCRAHIFLAEKESASGRYICCAVNTSVPKLAKFLSNRYPQYNIPTEFGVPSEAKLIVSSEKLVKEGFEFKYGIEEIYDQTVAYLKTKGLLKN